MAKIHINFLVMETFDRLFGATALLEALDKAIPDMEWHEREGLKELAERENWEYEDYDVERQALDARFHWVPRLAAYSIISVLQSIVETQLLACAQRVGSVRSSAVRVEDIRGKGVEQAAGYFRRVVSLDVTKDAAWDYLLNLRELRNAIIHRGGKRGKSQKHQLAMDRLLAAYPGRLLFQDGNAAFYGEIWISMNLCRDFAREIEGFFKRLFKAVGLPDRGMTSD